eukprot:CAMPEP_0202869032 /NCGR_PEP_ID=MMETSP1391-20130828/11649_1 /ASSEMBLY_ACC=CAM_ASM_000867 /TAXON_ID=1034604 /ORGANISM="Chlamydomonas leiostraca, Strain SAG 11-49" /LENGTH=840 /DNA_ID=CAMNT_0049549279 /DNA_START=91 /DNA_END=2610 /DNA_ORIENTATION=+
MGGTGVKTQAGALIRKSWNYQKRNVGGNICLCSAPIFFCVILAIMQALINRVFLSNDDFKCGCKCTTCCPEWALASQAGNFTSDGAGNITIPASNAAAWQPLLAQFQPSQISTGSDGSIKITTCSAINSGACPVDDGWKCKSKDKSQCGIQYSSTQQSAFCPVPNPSVWPAVMQVPSRDRRAEPYPGAPEGEVGFLITADSNGLSAQDLGNNIITGQISSNPATWASALQNLYQKDAQGNNVFNGDQLSTLGFQFGTDADPQIALYIERSFSAGEELYLMIPSPMCTAKNISITDEICLGDFLQAWFKGTPFEPILANSSIATSCAGSAESSTTSDSLINAGSLRVYCAETFPMVQPNAVTLQDILYCGYYQARCNINDLINNEFMSAFDFQDSGASKLSVDLYINQTINQGGGGQPGRNMRIPATMSAAVASWWKLVTGASSDQSPLDVLGVMSMPKEASELRLDFSSLLGPLFYSWVVQLLLPTFLQQLVYEKEKRLRTMMKMHGLGDVAYWTVTYLWFLLLYIVYIAIFIIFGAAINLKMFRRTNLGIQIIFYLLFGNCMIAFSFLLSSLFSTTRTAVVVAFLYVFATGLLGELLLQPFMADDKSWVFFAEWVPAFSLYRGLFEMSSYTFLAEYTNSRSGLTFAKLKDDGNGMTTTWAIFAVEWAIFLVLGWYLEQVLPGGNGIRRRPLFFIDWMWRKPDSHLLEGRHSLDGSPSFGPAGASKVTVRPSGELDDVDAERRRVEALADYSDNPIVLKDLKKIYPGLDGGKPKLAVRSLTMGVQRGECLGLLGPNGAGKTTSINMMTGFLEPTAGTGVVEGLDIRTDMPSIYKLMGVCP